MYKNLAAVIAAACFLSPFFPLTATAAQPAQASASSGNKPVKAAFVYVTPVFEAGWNPQHAEGRKAVEKSLGN